MRKQYFLSLLLAASLSAFASPSLCAAELTDQTFSNVKQLIEPQAGEGLWRNVPWETDLTTARRKAAADGKPLLIWAGGGSAPLGGC